MVQGKVCAGGAQAEADLSPNAPCWYRQAPLDCQPNVTFQGTVPPRIHPTMNFVGQFVQSGLLTPNTRRPHLEGSGELRFSTRRYSEFAHATNACFLSWQVVTVARSARICCVMPAPRSCQRANNYRHYSFGDLRNDGDWVPERRGAYTS